GGSGTNTRTISPKSRAVLALQPLVGRTRAASSGTVGSCRRSRLKARRARAACPRQVVRGRPACGPPVPRAGQGAVTRILEVVDTPDAVARILHGARAPPRPPPPGRVLLFR